MIRGGFFDNDDIATEGFLFNKNKSVKLRRITDEDRSKCKTAVNIARDVCKKNIPIIAKKYNIPQSAYEIALEPNDIRVENELDSESDSILYFEVCYFWERDTYSSGDIDKSMKESGQTDGMKGFEELYKILSNAVKSKCPDMKIELDAGTRDSSITMTYTPTGEIVKHIR